MEIFPEDIENIISNIKIELDGKEVYNILLNYIDDIKRISKKHNITYITDDDNYILYDLLCNWIFWGELLFFPNDEEYKTKIKINKEIDLLIQSKFTKKEINNLHIYVNKLFDIDYNKNNPFKYE